MDANIVALTLLAIGVLGTSRLFYLAQESSWDEGLWVLGAILGIIPGGILAVLFIWIVGFTTLEEPKTVEDHHVYPISLNRDSELQGSFILGTGTIETVHYYFYYYKSVHGYSLIKSKVNETYLIETNDQIPEVVHVFEVREQSKNYWIKYSTEKYLRTVIYVPEGTIIREFRG